MKTAPFSVGAGRPRASPTNYKLRSTNYKLHTTNYEAKGISHDGRNLCATVPFKLLVVRQKQTPQSGHP